MTLQFEEKNWPKEYCTASIQYILSALLVQRSVQVVGLSGFGKSTLLRFFYSHPELLTQYPDFAFDEVVPMYVDCNSLRPANPLNFYRALNDQLPTPALDRDTLQDEYLLYRHIQAELASIPRTHFVYIIIDEVSNLQYDEREQFFGQLRSLRDQQRFNEMSFILGNQRPVDKLHRLTALFGDTCWVTPLSQTDQNIMVDHHIQRLRLNLAKDQAGNLQKLSGGHAGLLKNCLEKVKLLETPLRNSLFNDGQEAIISTLFQYPPILSHIERLWECLTEAEQHYLIDLNTPLQSNTPPPTLLDSGILIHNPPDPPRVFSPLWETYLREHIIPHTPNRPLQIKVTETRREVVLYWRGRSETITLSRKLVFNLFQALAQNPGEVVSKDQLIIKLYPDDEPGGISDDAIFQLITALRNEIDVSMKRLCPALRESFIQNVRGAGYRLLVDLPLSTND